MKLTGAHASSIQLMHQITGFLVYDCFGRYYVIYRLPNLTFLDSRPVKKEERDESQRVGAHMKIVAPSTDDLVSKKQQSTMIFF